ncbi:MAG: hypothetical protein ACYCT1_07255 [Steroidobacteraceae bacterium]
MPSQRLAGDSRFLLIRQTRIYGRLGSSSRSSPRGRRRPRSLGGDASAYGENLTLTARQDIAAPVTLRGLLAKCFAENDRRMLRHDARLLRPRRVPDTARVLYRILPKSL